MGPKPSAGFSKWGDVSTMSHNSPLSRPKIIGASIKISITGLFLSLAEFELDPVTAAVNHFNHVVAGLPQLALIGVTGVDKVEKERTVGIENLILCLGVIVIYRDVKHLAVFCAQHVTMRRARYQMARARLRPNALVKADGLGARARFAVCSIASWCHGTLTIVGSGNHAQIPDCAIVVADTFPN